MKKLGLWIFVMALTLGVGLGTYFYFGSSQAVASLDDVVFRPEGCQDSFMGHSRCSAMQKPC